MTSSLTILIFPAKYSILKSFLIIFSLYNFSVYLSKFCLCKEDYVTNSYYKLVMLKYLQQKTRSCLNFVILFFLEEVLNSEYPIWNHFFNDHLSICYYQIRGPFLEESYTYLLAFQKLKASQSLILTFSKDFRYLYYHK